MEHTDAGVHTVLADVERPAESPLPGVNSTMAGGPPHAHVSPSEQGSPVLAGVAGTGAAVGRSGDVPGNRVSDSRVPDGVLADLGDDDIGDDDIDDVVDEVDDVIDDEGDDELAAAEPAKSVGRAAGTARPGSSASSRTDLIAQVIEIGLGDILGESMEWQERALCAQTDPEAFFPEKGGSTREAKRICAGCEVRVECLEYALENDERFGIWGGMSERERRKQRRRAV